MDRNLDVEDPPARVRGEQRPRRRGTAASPWKQPWRKYEVGGTGIRAADGNEDVFTEAEGRDTSVTSSCPELIYGPDVRAQRPRSVLLVVKCERKERSRERTCYAEDPSAADAGNSKPTQVEEGAALGRSPRGQRARETALLPLGKTSSRDPRTRLTAAAKASGAGGFPRKRLRRPLSWNGVDFTPTMGGTQSPPTLFKNSGDIRD